MSGWSYTTIVMVSPTPICISGGWPASGTSCACACAGVVNPKDARGAARTSAKNPRPEQQKSDIRLDAYRNFGKFPRPALALGPLPPAAYYYHSSGPPIRGHIQIVNGVHSIRGNYGKLTLCCSIHTYFSSDSCPLHS